MTKGRSAALPLLFAVVLLAAGSAVLLLPLLDCPPCLGYGDILAAGPGALNLYECRLCRRSGLLPVLKRLRADLNPDRHRGALIASSFWSKGLD